MYVCVCVYVYLMCTVVAHFETEGIEADQPVQLYVSQHHHWQPYMHMQNCHTYSSDILGFQGYLLGISQGFWILETATQTRARVF